MSDLSSSCPSVDAPLATEALAIIDSLAAGNRIGVLTQAVLAVHLARLCGLACDLRRQEQMVAELVEESRVVDIAIRARANRLRDAGPGVIDFTRRRLLRSGPYGGNAA